MEKLYVVSSSKVILGMADIQGPLTTPSPIKFADVLEMVRMGYEIYQVNPYDHTEKVRVTVSNINDIKFTVSRSKSCVQRKLNKEIQEMNKPILVDVVAKESKQNEYKFGKDQGKQTKNTENKNSEKENVDVAKVDKPDDFFN